MNGDRLRIARESLGWSQTELAERLDVTQSTVAYIEAGRFLPSEKLTERIYAVTGFSRAFLEKPEVVPMGEGSLLFRSKAQARQSDKTRAFRFGQLATELVDRLMERVKPLSVQIPRLDEEPKVAARLTRSALGLPPDTPIPGLINHLERRGVLVVMMPEPLDGLDGYSTWAGPQSDRPLIVLSPGAPPDRLRLTVAHELGHLVMHHRIDRNFKLLEDETDIFAGEFLMPENAVLGEMHVPVNLADLAALKTRWGISIGALIFRAEETGLINARQKSYLFQQLTKRGWRNPEPFGETIPMERPRGIRQLMELGYGKAPNFMRMSMDLGLPAPFIEQMFSLGAGSSGNAPTAPAPEGKVVNMRVRKV